MDLKFRYYGDPILRKVCDKVDKIDDEIKELVEAMWAEFDRHTSVGLSGPQCGVLQRIFIARFDDYQRDGKIVKGQRWVFINPELTNHSEETEWMDEGCLSVPGLWPPVERPKTVTCTAQDLEGKTFQVTWSGYEARVLMHENDHLNGVLNIDRVKGRERKIIEPRLRQIKKRYYLRERKGK